MGPHNTADDPTRYVDPEELEAYRALDPVARLRGFLLDADLLSYELEQRMQSEIEEELAASLAAAEARGAARTEQIFDHVYVDPPPRLLEQRRALTGEEQ
jgi:pyruvate dehydrogenase E1 component alpha subunit